VVTARKAKKPETSELKWRWLRRGIGPALLPVLGAAVFLVGLAFLGKLARDHLRHDQRYTIAFADIDCEPPPGTERGDFLDDVQYRSSLPNDLSLLDEDLAERLSGAFARHPWVAKVEAVETSSPRRVHVTLHYRVPVLAVRCDGQLRAVDAQGIVLPATASVTGLPVYQGTAKRPNPAGSPWGDTEVEAAARAAAPSRNAH
jgi:hypothetical protein